MHSSSNLTASATVLDVYEKFTASSLHNNSQEYDLFHNHLDK